MHFLKQPNLILLIEDDFTFGQCIQTCLTAQNFTVKWAQTFEEGLELISKYLQHETYAVIIDGNLGRCSSIPLVHQISSIPFAGRIIAISGQHEMNNTLMKEGCTDVLRKPFPIQKLLKILNPQQTA